MMARRIPGEFVPSDVNLVDDPSIMRAGAMAELLFRRANEHAKRTHRDGLIYAIELTKLCHGIPGRATNHADALVREGLWDQSGADYVIRSFLKWNLSQEEQSEAKRQKQIGAIKTNHKKHTEKESSCPICRGEMEA